MLYILTQDHITGTGLYHNPPKNRQEMHAKELLQNYDTVIQMPVTWGSMDAFEHVNNVVYFKYFEDVRIAYFEKTGIGKYMKEHGVGPILASTQCRFKAPLTYPDTVHIGARVTRLESDRFLMDYLVVSEQLQRVAAQGDGLIVSYDYKNNQKTNIPQAWRDNIQVHLEDPQKGS